MLKDQKKKCLLQSFSKCIINNLHRISINIPAKLQLSYELMLAYNNFFKNRQKISLKSRLKNY